MKTNYSIIITDDDADDADDHQFLTDTIKNVRSNCQITSAYNGLELMDILYRMAESRQPLPDLIILDLNMPLMNGYEVLKKIKAIPVFAHIPVYILTTSEFEYDKVKAIAYGASAFYSKPFFSNELTAVMEEIFSKANIPVCSTI